MNKLITIIIPCYNEINTIESLILKIHKLDLNKQIILIDDGSNDGTLELIDEKLNEYIDVFVKKKNEGKGSAIIAAKEYIKGDIVIIQDADLEYDPNDYNNLIEPIIKKKTRVVYGSRVLGKNRYLSNNFSSILRIFYNHALTILSNFLNKQSLTDAHTCYKVFEADIFQSLNLKAKKFNFCAEVNCLLGKKNIKILEVPISYKGRTFEEGKKIRFKDGIETIITLIRYKFLKN